MTNTLRVIFGGDVMLGRLVKTAIQENGPRYPMGKIAPIMRNADITIINLECAITATEKHWTGHPKAFYFGAPPEAIDSLVDAGVDMVSLANNHILDFNYAGLKDTLYYLDKNNIKHTGAGENIVEALAPSIVESEGIRLGMVSFCNHQRDFSASATQAGFAYIDLDNKTQTLNAFEKALEILKQSKVDWPILSLHWGPNMVRRPSPYFVELAHAAIDMGYKILFGHSAHVFHGIEIYKGCPILYAAGDLVDDYYVDPEFKNDHSLLFEFEITKIELNAIQLHPVFIEKFHTVPATGKSFDYIAKQARKLCAEMGTKLIVQENQLIVTIPNSK